MNMSAVDLFAGPGGWDVAARDLGLEVLGIEFDHAACETRRAAGLLTIEGDVRAHRNLATAGYDGLIASPPCQTFSTAGKGAGRAALDDVLLGVKTLASRQPFDPSVFSDERTGLVLEPLVWALNAIDAGKPFQWIALEQVPTVLPVWEAFAEVLRAEGYSVATGNLQAEQYGVPQTRKRAVLVARLGGEAALPTPTHSKYYSRSPEKLDPGVLPWVSMAEALGWGMDARPSMTVTGGGSATGGAEPFGNGARQSIRREQDAGRWVQRSNYSAGSSGGTAEERGRTTRPLSEPSVTATSKGFQWIYVNGNQANAARRPDDKPAPTVHFGAAMNDVRWITGQARNNGPAWRSDRHRALDEPSYTIRANGSGSHPSGTEWTGEILDGKTNTDRGHWGHSRPAPTVVGTRRAADGMIIGRRLPDGEGRNVGGWSGDVGLKAGQLPGVRVSVEEAATLQSFPEGYPWQGSKTKQYQQVGNAVPPLLARAILQTLSTPPRPGVRGPAPADMGGGSMTPYYSDDQVTLWHGDCIATMQGIPDASVAAIITDPPYGLGFMGKEWDALPPGREWAEECLRVLKPGGHLLAFGGTRTWHRLAVAVEDAGFEIRDSIAWMYGSGFPKSLDVSKAIDKANGRRFEDRYALGRHIRERREAAGLSRAEVNAWFGYRDGCEHWERQDPSGARVPTLADWHVLADRLGLSDEFLPLVERVEAEREVIGVQKRAMAGWAMDGTTKFVDRDITAPATPEAQQWQGWGTALKPAFEPIVVARKPLQGTVAANVLEHGTGALNIDGCRIGTRDKLGRPQGTMPQPKEWGTRSSVGTFVTEGNELGRWPANVVLDEDQAAALLPRTGHADSGGASRFFYTAKADAGERITHNGIAHPTVKPLDLMRWLIRLVTPPGGTILEPFAGSGTTVEAALIEGFDCIAIEREADYLPLITQRINRRRDPVAYLRESGEDLGLFGEAS